MSAHGDAQFERLLRYLRQQRGFDFTGYKRPGLVRRVSRRMQRAGIAGGYEGYLDYLEVHPDELALLLNAILVNVTSFFRDEAAWSFVAKEVLPALLAAKKPHQPVRVWSAGCASGEEAYTIAMLFAEAMGLEPACERLEVYATDVDEKALEHGRLASYAAKDLENVDKALRDRYFEPFNGRCAFRGDLRSTVIFGRHDLVREAPIPRLDLLVCRNTLMYFDAETQGRIMQRFHFALNGDGGGYLFLGCAEMPPARGTPFRPLDLKCRVFAKLPEGGASASPDGSCGRRGDEDLGA